MAISLPTGEPIRRGHVLEVLPPSGLGQTLEASALPTPPLPLHGAGGRRLALGHFRPEHDSLARSSPEWRPSHDSAAWSEPGLLSLESGSAAVGIEAAPAPGRLQLLVAWDPRASAEQRDAALARLGGNRLETIHTAAMQLFSQGVLEVIELPPGMALEQAIRLYSNRPGVLTAEGNAPLGIDAVSNDPAYVNGSLWGMYGDATTPSNAYGSQAGEAWANGALGSTKTVMGVIDTGIDYTHIDLYQNIWLNQGELRSLSFFALLKDTDNDGLISFRDLNQSANSGLVSDLNGNNRIDAGDLLADNRWVDGLDNDGNGYRDDLIGWDFINNDNNPYDDHNHGTHCAGTIGALGSNGTGVAGVAWNTLLMPLKFLSASGSGSTSDAVKALDYYTYATQLYDSAYNSSSSVNYVGTSNSWGGGTYLQAMADAIGRTAKLGDLFIAAAGNSGVNIDNSPFYPACYSAALFGSGPDAVVAVASISSTGERSSFSNYGSSTVDLAAPGSSVYSTVRGDSYAVMSGTSMATPHVAGALALLAATYPSATPQQLLQALYEGSVATTSLAGLTVTGARLDVNRAITRLGQLVGGSSSSPIQPVISVMASDAAAAETAAGSPTDPGSFTLSRSGETSAALTVSVGFSGTATNGADYSSLGSTVTFAPGSATAVVVVTPIDDSSVEGSEPVTLSLQAGAGYTISSSAGSASLTIADNDSLPPSSSEVWGTSSNDTLSGDGIVNLIGGVSQLGSDTGRATIDVLTGNGGADTFALADTRRGTFYNDRNNKSQGTGDYAQIKDFNLAEGDQLQFNYNTQILYRNVTSNNTTITEIFLGNGDNKLNSADELIARLENTPLTARNGFAILTNESWATFV